jgi:branched-chain amino acid aminotransferase
VKDCSGEFFILDGKLYPSGHFDNSLVYEGETYYEVIRVIGGLPLFFDDHADRLQTSIKLSGRNFIIDKKALKRYIIELTAAEKRQEINLKIACNFNAGKSSCLIYYIEPAYPTPEQYQNGVRGILFTAERKDPEVKIIDKRLRSAISHRLIIEKAYEALLTDRNGCITEGSRSNIFFISGNRLTTAPDNMVLGGITRKILLGVCAEDKITVDFRCLRAAEISDWESVVMTGTSPVVLPFNSIDDILFNVSHPLILHLRNRYLGKAEESMKQFAINM